MAGEYLPPVVTELTGNADDLLRTIAEAKAAMASLKDAAQDIKIKVGIAGIIGPTAGAIAQINALKGALGGLDNQTIKITTDTNVGAAAITRAVATQGRAWGFWGLTALQWFKLVHNSVTIFGAQVISDTIGIIAFGTAAARTLSPVFSNISNLGAAWQTYSGAQRLAAQNTYDFINNLQSHDTQVVAVYDNLLQVISSHMNAMGGATAQATQAFLIFGNEVRSALGSPEFQRFLGGHAIAQDLAQLGTTIIDLAGALVALAHNFNFLGSWALSGMGMVLRAFTWLNNVNPTLARTALLTLTAYHAFQFLQGLALTRFFATAIAGLMGVNAALAATDAELSTTAGLSALAGETNVLGRTLISLRTFGLMPTLSLLTGLDAAGLAAASALGVFGAALGVAIVVGNAHALSSINDTIGALRISDAAVGANVAGYEKFSATLDSYSKNLSLAGATNKEFAANVRASGNGVSAIKAAFDSASASAHNTATNLTFLMNRFGLSAEQAYQLAKALGLVGQLGSKAFTPQQIGAIQQYVRTQRLASQTSTALKFDMQQAANAALGLQSQIQGLSNAFNVLVTPFANTIQATVTWKNDLLTLASDVKAASGQVGYHTAAQKLAASALATSLNDTVALSNSTLASTGSYRQAAAIIYQEITALEGLHSKSSLVSTAIDILRQQLDSLKSKSITITTNFVNNGNPYGGPTQIRASGTGPNQPQALSPSLVLGGAPRQSVTINQPAPAVQVFIDSREITKAVQIRSVRRQRRSGFNGTQRILR